MLTDELDFDLPPDLIAQEPSAQRTDSRLLHYRQSERAIEHRTFSDLPDLLRSGDLLVFNDARVIPARFMLHKSTGGRVEGLFLQEAVLGRWNALLKNPGPTQHLPMHFAEDPSIGARIVENRGEGEYQIEIDPPQPASALLERIGRMPLPPYIRRGKDFDQRDHLDRDRYQTVFAKTPGAVAAPTAAFHFTPELFARLESRHVQRAFVTLHVGVGTFRPVNSHTLEGHTMHTEAYSISAEAADALNRAKSQRRRIIPVGTTAARVLESQPADQPFAARSDTTGIFIFPPYRWKHADALITNFHLPRSTLIALVAARVGLDEQRQIYANAIENRYRFFSYGDAMFID